MSVLLLAEISNSELALKATAKAVNAAKNLGNITVLVAGGSVIEAAKSAAKIDGVAKVLIAEDESLEHSLAEATATLIASFASDFEYIVAPATTNAKNVMPRVAALLDVMIISDATEVVDRSTFVRPVYAGNAMQTVKSNDSKKVITFRVSSFNANDNGNSAPIEAVTISENLHLSEWVNDQIVDNNRPDLTSASIVVSGGRGLGSKENFKFIEEFADKLGAATGATRAAVDAGYADNDLQIGQTGKIVAPELYFAIGLSGAIQHLAGMKDSKIIVAINKDSEAPIFQIADFGLAMDLFDVLPELIRKLD